MRPPPSWLPAADSRKWHNRRLRDWYGYLRVRTLSNPQWTRDTKWLVTSMTRGRPEDPGNQRDAFDRALIALKNYRSVELQTSSANKDQIEALWDTYLDALDAYLWLIHEEHLQAVAEAGMSGPTPPRRQVKSQDVDPQQR